MLGTTLLPSVSSLFTNKNIKDYAATPCSILVHHSRVPGFSCAGTQPLGPSNLTVKELLPREAQGHSEALVVTGGHGQGVEGRDSFLTSISISNPDGGGGSIRVTETELISSGETAQIRAGPTRL